MGISSLGVGSSILTQDVIDQLRDADSAAIIRPLEYKLANEKDKKNALEVLDASMTNFIDSITDLKLATIWNERSATVNSGTSVEVSAVENTDVQDFTLDVTNLATKQIEQSGSFTAITEVVGVAGGTFDIQVGAASVNINYDAGATLDNIKDLINKEAGNLVDATIVQIATGDFRLFLTSDETGASSDISIANAPDLAAGLTTDTSLSTAPTIDPATIDPITNPGGSPYAAVQEGIDANFTFNGQAITRTSNVINDLITGLTLTLKAPGASDVSIAQDNTSILKKFDSFVNKYNSSMTELDRLTKVSVEDDKGIFSSDSTIKSMKRALENMIDSVGGGVGSIVDYGFEIDRDGKMTLDKTVLETAMNDNPTNVQAFFTGGVYTDPTTAAVTTLTGAFSEMATTVEGYTNTNQTLDQVKNSITSNISTIEDRKTTATERLDSKYEIMKKQWAAYDLMISKFNSASSMFVQMANAQIAAG